MSVCAIAFFMGVNCFGIIQGDSVLIKGNAPAYGGYTLVFESQSNFINRELTELARIRVDEKGFFNHVFPLTEVTKGLVRLGVYEGYIFLEPGKEYEIVLPQFEKVPEKDQMNPFFTPQRVALGITGNDGLLLNSQIRDFDESFTTLYTDNVYRLFKKEKAALADTLIALLEKDFPSDTISFFYHYKRYKYAQLYDLTFQRQKRKVITKFFTGQPVQFNNPAYGEAFNQVFSRFFNFYFSSRQGKPLKKAFGSHRFDSLSIALGDDPVFEDSALRETLLLKSLYDAFYSGNYSPDVIIDLVRQSKETVIDDKNREVAGSIEKVITRLRPGTPAPEFELFSTSGKLKSLSNYRGKFVYLSFCNTRNFACKKDMQVLNAFARSMRKELTVVTILTDENELEAKKYLKENKLKWNILHYTNRHQVVLDYNIKALPTYYLIDPQGKISLAPAPAPEENFRDAFFQLYQSYNFKKLRKERPKEKSIYDL